jgi:hypothetical protein
MKKSLILGGFLTLAFAVQAQWTNVGSDIYNNYGAYPGAVAITNYASSPWAGPQTMLHVGSSNPYDGITVEQLGTSGPVVFGMFNSTTNGLHYTFYSTGTGDTYPGSLEIYDNTSSGSRFFIQGTQNSSAELGNIGIGTYNTTAKFNVVEAGLTGTAGRFESTSPVSGVDNVGITASASNGDLRSVAGEFNASGSNNGNIGVLVNCGASSTPANDWGVYSNAKAYFNGIIIGSDRKLKNNIKPLAPVMGKIMSLKPSTYTYRSDEFKSMNFPAGEQIGLIAQEVEEVFPSVINEVGEITRKNSKGETIMHAPNHKGVNYISLIPVLIKGMQEQEERITQQQQQIEELKALVHSLADKNGINTGVPVALSDKNVIVLNQNVPNPFAESTVISYNVPADFHKAQILFTGGNGTVIKTVDINQKGPGTLNVYANDLSKGLYSYSLIVDGKTIDTKKMIKE